MSFSVGIIGLPNVGKSTLFSALTKKQVERANYPFTTINPNVGIVEVPDKQLDKISRVSNSLKTIPTTIEFIDIAGLVKNAHLGEGLGNEFLSHIRECDAICHVVRSFVDKNVSHVHGGIDPQNDINIINLELIMADIKIISKRIDALEKKAKTKLDKTHEKMLSLYKKAREWLEKEKLLYDMDISEVERKTLEQDNFLTIKSMLIVCNDDEKKSDKKIKQGAINLSAKLEEELNELHESEKKQFLKELGRKNTAVESLIKESYRKLNLITFYTTNKNETRAWTLEKGASAKDGAGKVHTDMEKGFIKGDFINAKDFIENGGWAESKKKGLVHLEGKNYIIKEQDIAYFYFK